MKKLIKLFLVTFLLLSLLGFADGVVDYGRVDDSKLGWITFRENYIHRDIACANYILILSEKMEKKFGVLCIQIFEKREKGVIQIAITEKIDGKWKLEWVN